TCAFWCILALAVTGLSVHIVPSQALHSVDPRSVGISELGFARMSRFHSCNDVEILDCDLKNASFFTLSDVEPIGEVLRHIKAVQYDWSGIRWQKQVQVFLERTAQFTGLKISELPLQAGNSNHPSLNMRRSSALIANSQYVVIWGSIGNMIGLTERQQK